MSKTNEPKSTIGDEIKNEKVTPNGNPALVNPIKSGIDEQEQNGANIEVLRNSRKKTLHLAPLFDHGLSLLCRCINDSQVEAFDVMEDKLCNNYIGSKSTWENLKLIPADKMPALNQLHESDKEIVMEGLEGIISQTLQDKIWNMIWKRWCAYEDFCNSR